MNENSENSSKAPRFNRRFWIVSSVILTLTLACFMAYRSNQKLEAEIEDLKSKGAEQMQQLVLQLDVTKSKLSLVTEEKDSLFARLQKAEPYFPLIGMLHFRDSVENQLPFQVGDIVRIKPDSAKAVVADIEVSGSKFSHQVLYKVINKKREELYLDATMLWPNP